MSIDFRDEIHFIADTTYGTWKQAGLPPSERAAHLDRALAALLGDTSPYVSARVLLTLPPLSTVPLDHRVRALNKRLRARVMARDGMSCGDCMVETIPVSDRRSQGPSDFTIDHIIPVSFGGNNDPVNLRVLCRSCNSRKGAR